MNPAGSNIWTQLKRRSVAKYCSNMPCMRLCNCIRISDLSAARCHYLLYALQYIHHVYMQRVTCSIFQCSMMRLCLLKHKHDKSHNSVGWLKAQGHDTSVRGGAASSSAADSLGRNPQILVPRSGARTAQDLTFPAPTAVPGGAASVRLQSRGARLRYTAFPQDHISHNKTFLMNLLANGSVPPMPDCLTLS